MWRFLVFASCQKEEQRSRNVLQKGPAFHVILRLDSLEGKSFGSGNEFSFDCAYSFIFLKFSSSVEL